MRIAIWHNLPSGGGKRALYQQVEGLLARGHTVEAWCPAQANQDFLPLSQLVQEHVLPCPPVAWRPEVVRSGLRRIFLHYKNTRHVLGVMDAHARQAAAEITAGRFDVLLAHPCQQLRVPAIGRYVRGPRVLYLQEPYRQLYEAAPRLPWVADDWEPRYWRSPQAAARFVRDALGVQALRLAAREELASVRAFDRVLVNSLFSRESLLRAYGVAAQVCYLGLDAERFRPSGAPRERLVVSLGALHPTKRVDLAVRTVAAIAPAQRPPLVWVANFADVVYQQGVEALAKELGVSLTVYLGVDDAAVVGWLSRAAVMLYTPRLEPFGFAPLEANACETPVVAVAEGGVRETVQDGVNGRLLESDDPAALGAALLALLDDPPQARRLGVAGRQRVLDHWQWSRSVEALEQALDGCARAGRGPQGGRA
ncbi:MAG: glycosyltransferase family 4 protein [Anaerolineales bacterium]|nr:glycosyltransferase family 4 protein [Anaerolineales bacterium]